MDIVARELSPDEFALAEKVWEQYRGQKANRTNERIFGIFVNGTLAATARCTEHPDGREMDNVFTLDEFRGKGYARQAVELLLEHCGSATIYIHSTLPLVSFYQSLGFSPIPEQELPQTIRERFLFCFGQMEACNVSPMKRMPERPSASH
ncbi:MAG: GNAT family N-acetyltransferase [Methanomicrobiales archaeon]|nr:GNAT family N-acetyltransferase [Methanomicrobiales archaeon]